jgi:hypothetical protein
MKLEFNIAVSSKASKSMLHTLPVIHYNQGTLTNFSLTVKLKGIDSKCHFC